jgi:hypothetical protein
MLALLAGEEEGTSWGVELELRRTKWPLTLSPRGWTAQHPHLQAALTLPQTLGSAEARARACFSAFRVWLATASVVTVASQILAGPASTWACCSASSVQASTGGPPNSGQAGWGCNKAKVHPDSSLPLLGAWVCTAPRCGP